MNVLIITNMFPTAKAPWQGTFVEQQVRSLEHIADLQILHIDRVERGRLAYASAFGRIRRAIARHQSDVIHVMNGGLLSLVSAAASGGKPLVISYCGSDLLGEPLASPLQRLAGRLSILASWIAAARATAIIVKSRELARALPRFVPARKVQVVPNGIDLERFRPASRSAARKRLGWPADEFSVLFAGDPRRPVKRFHLVRDAVEILRIRGVQANVRVMQGVPHTEVPAWLNAASVLALSSVHEGSPNIVKEALACACPVVSVDVGDVAERISGAANCVLATPDTVGIADGLWSVFRNPDRPDGRPGIAALALPAVAEKVASVYRRVAASKSSPIRGTAHTAARAEK